MQYVIYNPRSKSELTSKKIKCMNGNFLNIFTKLSGIQRMTSALLTYCLCVKITLCQLTSRFVTWNSVSSYCNLV